MTVIVDYGVGNLFSLQSSLSALKIPARVSGSAEEIVSAQRVILPGVGAFGDAMDKLRQTRLLDAVKEVAARGTPLLGICLGMQLLFEKSTEFGEHVGLGLLKGEIGELEKDLQAAGFDYKVPHMGWNPLRFLNKSPLLQYSKEGACMYYVHSYYAKYCEECLVAASEYGIDVPGIVQCGNVFGTQFHPEKSGEDGLALLRAFAEVPTC